MRLRRGWIWYLAGLLLAIIAGAVAIFALQQAVPAAKPAAPATRPIIVARQDLAVRTIVLPESIEARDVPLTDIPSGAIFRLDDAAGKMLMQPATAGQPLLAVVGAWKLTARIESERLQQRHWLVQWQRLAKDTIEWSKIHRAPAIIVSKADRTLTLYRNGQKVLSYSVRLGFNGIREKRYQGDGATPEGRYRIISKRGQGQTQFYRALVLDYPNEADRRRFVVERKTGNIPALRGIGGQIEIHGVENELMAQTLGCVMLENPHMTLLFDRVEKGTPVTIVGALHEQNAVALALANLSARRDET